MRALAVYPFPAIYHGSAPLLRLALTPVITPKQRAEIPPSTRCQVNQFCLSTMYFARLYSSSKVMISMPCIDLLNLWKVSRLLLLLLNCAKAPITIIPLGWTVYTL